MVDAELELTHLDWHCLADGVRADTFDLSTAIAAEYGLAARVWLDDGGRKAAAYIRSVRVERRPSVRFGDADVVGE